MDLKIVLAFGSGLLIAYILTANTKVINKPMSAKKKKSTKKQAKTQKQSKEVSFDWSNWFSINLIGLIVSIVIILFLYYNIQGYRWVWDSLVMGNLKVIQENHHLTIEKKWEIKCGFDFSYLNYIKSKTPDNAIILMPAYSDIYPEGEESDFNNRDAGGIKNKAWATYFLYPRKLVYEEEGNTNPLYEKADYVAIVNFNGYDKLNYSVENKEKYQVLPRNLTSTENQ